MALRLALIVIALPTGGFMLADGSRNLLTGTYFGGGQLGPWSLLVSAAGLDPRHLGAVFVLAGAAWLVALAGLLSRRRWGWPAGIAVAVGTLWYLPVGTVFAMAGSGSWPGAGGTWHRPADPRSSSLPGAHGRGDEAWGVGMGSARAIESVFPMRTNVALAGRDGPQVPQRPRQEGGSGSGDGVPPCPPAARHASRWSGSTVTSHRRRGPAITFR